MSFTGAVPNLMQAVLWIWPVMYKSIYGRFLLLQLGSTNNVVALNVLISVFNVASRLSSRQVHAGSHAIPTPLHCCSKPPLR